MYSNSEISFYTDTLIAQIVLQDKVAIEKTAADGIISSLIQKVKEYVSNHIDPNNRAGSVLNILAPGAIAMTFSAMGLGWLGTLIGLATRVFNINVGEILGSIWNKLKSTIAWDKPTSSDQVDSIVNSSIQEHVQPPTTEEAERAIKLMTSKNATQAIKDARLIRLSMIEYENVYIYKTADKGDFLSMFSSRKSKTVSILRRVLSWIFKVALASAGLMVAGDAVNKFLGRPNAFDGTIQQGKPVEQATTPIHTSSQKKFPIKPTYKSEVRNVGDDNWIENIPNNSSAITTMLVNFAKEVYDGLDGKESLITSSSGFNIVRDRIVWYNRNSAGAPFIVIPKYFRSKKHIVDYFIDEVAEKS